MSERRRTADATQATDTVRAVACDVALLRWIEPCWDVLPDRWKADVLAELEGVGQERRSSNTTCVELDEYAAQNLNRAIATNQYVTEMALGTDSASGTAYADRSLNTEHARLEITEFIDNGTSVLCRVFADTDQANDPNDPSTSIDIVELGLYAGAFFCNHSTFAAVAKDNTTAAVFESELIFDTDPNDA